MWVVLCFSERREDSRIPQKTPGFKIFRNILYSPNKTRMVKGDAEIGNSLTRELAGFVVQQLMFGTKRDNFGLVPVFFEVSETQKGRDVS